MKVESSLTKMSQDHDVYGLLALSLSREDKDDEQIKDLFVKTLKTELYRAYITPPTQITAGRMDTNLLKLIGRDARPFLNDRGHLQGLFDELVGFQVKDDYKEAQPFTITPDGARALCSVIREQNHVDQLIIHSRGEEQTLSNEVIRILTQKLPKDRFKYLEIVTKVDETAEKILAAAWLHLCSSKGSIFIYQDHQGNQIALPGAARPQDNPQNSPFIFGTDDGGDY